MVEKFPVFESLRRGELRVDNVLVFGGKKIFCILPCARMVVAVVELEQIKRKGKFQNFFQIFQFFQRFKIEHLVALCGDFFPEFSVGGNAVGFPDALAVEVQRDLEQQHPETRIAFFCAETVENFDEKIPLLMAHRPFDKVLEQHMGRNQNHPFLKFAQVRGRTVKQELLRDRKTATLKKSEQKMKKKIASQQMKIAKKHLKKHPKQKRTAQMKAKTLRNRRELKL